MPATRSPLVLSISLEDPPYGSVHFRCADGAQDRSLKLLLVNITSRTGSQSTFGEQRLLVGTDDQDLRGGSAGARPLGRGLPASLRAVSAHRQTPVRLLRATGHS